MGVRGICPMKSFVFMGQMGLSSGVSTGEEGLGVA